MAEVKKPESCTRSVLCFGHPLLDMMADVDESFLASYNVTSGSVTLAEPSQLSLFARLADNQVGVQYLIGGAALNTARFMAWIHPQMSVYYVGALGCDHFGQVLRETLIPSRVVGLFEEHRNRPTGTCAGLVCHKERTLISNLGAAVALSMQHMQSGAVQAAIAEAQLYYAEGFFLNTASSPDNLLYVAKHACENGKTFCLNLNAPYVCATFRHHLSVLMPYIDILFGNYQDMLAFAQATWPDCADYEAGDVSEDGDACAVRQRQQLEDVLLRIANVPSVKTIRPRLVVVTRGAECTLVASRNTVRSYRVPPIAEECIVDLNGAGDAFVAGFLAQYLHYADESLSTNVGHLAAQNCIRHQGAAFSGSPPRLTEMEIVNKFMMNDMSDITSSSEERKRSSKVVHAI